MTLTVGPAKLRPVVAGQPRSHSGNKIATSTASSKRSLEWNVARQFPGKKHDGIVRIGRRDPSIVAAARDRSSNVLARLRQRQKKRAEAR